MMQIVFTCLSNAHNILLLSSSISSVASPSYKINEPLLDSFLTFQSSITLYHSTKKWQDSFHILKTFSSDTHQSMKTSDSDLKVNRNIYPDAVNVIGCYFGICLHQDSKLSLV